MYKWCIFSVAMLVCLDACAGGAGQKVEELRATFGYPRGVMSVCE